MTSPTQFNDDAPEAMIARDMVKKAAIVGPILIIAFGFIWGVHGALSTAYGLSLVVANFVLAAAMLTWAGRISPGFVMGAALCGYLIRLSLIFMAIWLPFFHCQYRIEQQNALFCPMFEIAIR
jgi:hypothetical protein